MGSRKGRNLDVRPPSDILLDDYPSVKVRSENVGRTAPKGALKGNLSSA